MDMPASVAIVDHQAAGERSAGDDGFQGLDMVFGHAVPIVIEIFGSKLCEDILNGSHGYTPFINSLMMA